MSTAASSSIKESFSFSSIVSSGGVDLDKKKEEGEGSSLFSEEELIQEPQYHFLFPQKEEETLYTGKIHQRGRYYSSQLIIDLIDGKVRKVPRVFEGLKNAIEKSKYILELEDDWDDEGSLAYEKVTWLRAINFLLDYANAYYDQIKLITTPKIYHGPDGSIDILWENENISLLINIPEDEEKANFYGKNIKGQEIEGVFLPEDFEINLLPNIAV